jgi:NADPH:quinone reductase-like Zn-dependent oxidoreductase
MVAMGFIGTQDQMGQEGSGVVRNVGSKVTNISPGQLVMAVGVGLFRSRAVVNKRTCMALPPGMSLDEAGGTIAIFVQHCTP